MNAQTTACRDRLRVGFDRALSLLLWLATVVGSQAADWPGFRGGTAGVAEKEQTVTFFGPSSNLLWTVEIPRGHSSPVVVKDRVFLTAAAGNQLTTLCLERQSGKTRWEQNVPFEKPERVHKVNSLASPTPVSDGQRVYVYFGTFGVLAYDLDGKELWRKPLPLPKTFFNQGTGTSPVLAEGKLIVFVQIGSDSHLLALNPSDGQELWKGAMPRFNNSYSTPVIWKEEGKGMVGIACASRLTAFNLSDGKESWWVDGLGFQACSTPVVVGDRMIISSAGVQGELSNMRPPPTFAEMLTQYDRNSDGLIAFEEIPDALLFTDRQSSDGKGNMPLKQALGMFGGVKRGDKLDHDKWEEIRGRIIGFRTGDMNRTVIMAVRTGGKGDVTAARVLWTETKGVPEVPSPLVWDGRVYLIRSGGLLVCRELENGKLIYENRIDSPGGYFASPVLAGNRIYLASDQGTVTVVRAGQAFEVLARNELNEPIMASPSIAEKTIFVRTASHLWAFGEKPN